MKDYKGTIRWTPAPQLTEKRISMLANWSKDECLNPIADKVATGNVDFDIDCQIAGACR